MKRPVAEPCAPAHANSITVSDEDRPAVEEIAAGYDNQANHMRAPRYAGSSASRTISRRSKASAAACTSNEGGRRSYTPTRAKRARKVTARLRPIRHSTNKQGTPAQVPASVKFRHRPSISRARSARTRPDL